ncbi:IscS subfamily cysteine desulfurase [Planomicrobium sp. YIM 101495]|uniref:IscS subfamily cysteine desulfurase n=1 Tax=Planomicrobium sp. YIM 101495 TaxID=2665160 RepID=UPI0012B93620|nr:IscS subfamily cysteine desulfurase [Planomicrobium sp. YIM 101495]MTD30743.1 aminotransferase class V-fold PLP-dependent enzyme [Planomicrobium sp. YIM 101495]
MSSYLDAAATVPMREEALAAYVEAARSGFGNTQSLHDAGTEAVNFLDSCRGMLGQLLNGRSDGFYFTGNASEGNALAIRSLVKARPARCKSIVTSELEHASVLTVLNQLENEGYQIQYVPVDTTGTLDMGAYEEMVTEDTALVIMQAVNSEMGAVQDVARCARFAQQFGVPLHSDMVQALGKLPVDLAASDVASAVFSAHKIGGPKSVGIVYLNPAVHWQPVIDGTVHQNGFRAGTVDVPGIVSATIAAKLAVAEQAESWRNAVALQTYLLQYLPAGVVAAGDPTAKSPFIQGLLLPHVEGQWMMLECNRRQISISTGTACKIGAGEAMSAMLAMGVESDAARKFIRISFSGNTTVEELKRFIAVVETSLQEAHAKKE